MGTITCRHFGVCGGCSCHATPGGAFPLAYEEELAAKESRVRKLMAAYEVLEWLPILPSPDLWHYRNKMEYAFAAPYKAREGVPSPSPSPVQPLRRWRTPAEDVVAGARGEGIILGLRQQGHYDRVVDLETCHLVSPECFEILNRVRAWAKAAGLTGYHRKAHVGDLRYLVVREGRNTGQRMAVLIASNTIPSPLVGEGEDGGKRPLPPTSILPHKGGGDPWKSLRHAIEPLATTAWLGLTDAKSDVARADDMRLLWGAGAIEERLGPIVYRISPYSFFQTNTHGAERLYGLLAEWGQRIGGSLIDVYCGSGGISLALARRFDRVVGVDSNSQAIEDARFNAGRNGIGNVEFVAEDAVDFLKKLPASKLAVQLSAGVVDPPRPGLHPKALQALLELNPPRLAYVSCNPESLARDCQSLIPFYKIQGVQPVDLFPHTPHVETIAFLEHR